MTLEEIVINSNYNYDKLDSLRIHALIDYVNQHNRIPGQVGEYNSPYEIGIRKIAKQCKKNYNTLDRNLINIIESSGCDALLAYIQGVKPRDVEWLQSYNAFKAEFNKTGTFPTRGTKLATWINFQRRKYNLGRLETYKIQKLKEITPDIFTPHIQKGLNEAYKQKQRNKLREGLNYECLTDYQVECFKKNGINNVFDIIKIIDRLDYLERNKFIVYKRFPQNRQLGIYTSALDEANELVNKLYYKQDGKEDILPYDNVIYEYYKKNIKSDKIAAELDILYYSGKLFSSIWLYQREVWLLRRPTKRTFLTIRSAIGSFDDLNLYLALSYWYSCKSKKDIIKEIIELRGIGEKGAETRLKDVSRRTLLQVARSPFIPDKANVERFEQFYKKYVIDNEKFEIAEDISE